MISGIGLFLLFEFFVRYNNHMSVPNLGTVFPGLQMQGGRAFIRSPGPKGSGLGSAAKPVGGHLGGEADIMMISGLGQNGVDVAAAGMNIMQGDGTQTPVAPSFREQLSVPVTIGNMTWPLYVWLLLAFGVGGATGYYFGRRG